MRLRVRTRSRLVGGTFNLINLFNRYEVEGRENLFEAIERSRESGRGLITVSNHVSLFDDPMVLIALLKLRNFTVETKCWWSTACAMNFNPEGRSLGSRMVRWFNSTANMVFMERSHKGCKRHELPPSLGEVIRRRVGWKRMELLAERARRWGRDVEGMLRRFVTAPAGAEPTSLDQMGLIEACARLTVGDWLHFFPEGGRSRTLALREARPGAGKAIHATDADVLPICFYGTQDILPVGAIVPRPFRRIVVSVGRPLNRSILEEIRSRPAGVASYLDASRFALSGVAALRPAVLARYLGAEAAFNVLADEQAEQLETAEAFAGRPSLPAAERLPVETYPWAAESDEARTPDLHA
jgi:1-acyl-sn-glycerol-3-phosphate acyltransferase